jgi:hypothetical protein
MPSGPRTRFKRVPGATDSAVCLGLTGFRSAVSSAEWSPALWTSHPVERQGGGNPKVVRGSRSSRRFRQNRRLLVQLLRSVCRIDVRKQARSDGSISIDRRGRSPDADRLPLSDTHARLVARKTGKATFCDSSSNPVDSTHLPYASTSAIGRAPTSAIRIGRPILEIFCVVGSTPSALATVAKKSGTVTGPSLIAMPSGLVLP